MTVYEALGIKPLINAKGTYTALGGSLMLPEVVAAMAEAARWFVDINELEKAVGRRIARLLGCEAAHVTAGAAAALVQGTAAIIAGDDPERIKQLPDTTGMKTKVVVQKCQRNPYDQAVRTVGMEFVEVETEEEMRQALGAKPAMLLHVCAFELASKVTLQETLALAHEHGVPVFVDAAAELPPAENLTRYFKLGADLVTFSGGKGLRGPQASGLLAGKAEYVEAARLHGCPNHSIGRPMKIGKEEIIGLLKAVELYLQRDHEEEWRRWEAQLRHIQKALGAFPFVETGYVPPEIFNHVPRLFFRWAEQEGPLSREQVLAELREGDPRIELLDTEFGLTVTPNTLQPDEEETIAQRLVAIFSKAGSP